MPRPLDGYVTGSLSHRIGRGTMGDGGYEFEFLRTEELTLVRPYDGQPASVLRKPCPACGKALSYRVYSVRATRRRRAVWWALTAFAAALAIGGVVLANSLPDVGVSDVWVFVVVSAILGGVLALFLLVPLALGEYGVRGHRTGWPIIAKHAFALAPSDEDMPAVVCELCGHREVMDDFDYLAAKARLRQHTCTSA
ncbi:hypothetical protein [Streptomyces sp. NPDC004270]